MTARQALNIAENALDSAGIEPFQFEARQLLEFVTGLSKKDLLLGGRELTKEEEEALKKVTLRRTEGEPLQYILGKWEFYSLPFLVGPGVLVPRPDTELLVDTALEFLKQTPHAKVLDLCSGSGCIVIALAKNAPLCQYTAVEKSSEAANYLKQNITLNDVSVELVLDDIGGFPADEFGYDLIVSNPPYIPSDDIFHLQKETKNEPRLALDGGDDGLKFYRLITSRYVPVLKSGGKLGVEIGIGQESAVKDLFSGAGLQDIKVYHDIGGICRVIFGTVVNGVDCKSNE